MKTTMHNPSKLSGAKCIIQGKSELNFLRLKCTLSAPIFWGKCFKQQEIQGEKKVLSVIGIL